MGLLVDSLQDMDLEEQPKKGGHRPSCDSFVTKCPELWIRISSNTARLKTYSNSCLLNERMLKHLLAEQVFVNLPNC